MSDKLTPHFTLQEMTRSDYATRHGINNTAPADIVGNLTVTAEGLERIRALVASSITVQSGYRSPKVNAGVGGSTSSQHMKGEAADIVAPGYTPRELAERIVTARAAIEFDQLILEYPDANGWVHVSFVESREPRGQVLTKLSGKPYVSGLV